LGEGEGFAEQPFVQSCGGAFSGSEEGTGMTTEQKDRGVYETPTATVLGKVVAVTFGTSDSKNDYGNRSGKSKLD
jgi:hypothetical protein